MVIFIDQKNAVIINHATWYRGRNSHYWCILGETKSALEGRKGQNAWRSKANKSETFISRFWQNVEVALPHIM